MLAAVQLRPRSRYAGFRFASTLRGVAGVATCRFTRSCYTAQAMRQRSSSGASGGCHATGCRTRARGSQARRQPATGDLWGGVAKLGGAGPKGGGRGWGGLWRETLFLKIRKNFTQNVCAKIHTKQLGAERQRPSAPEPANGKFDVSPCRLSFLKDHIQDLMIRVSQNRDLFLEVLVSAADYPDSSLSGLCMDYR